MAKKITHTVKTVETNTPLSGAARVVPKDITANHVMQRFQ